MFDTEYWSVAQKYSTQLPTPWGFKIYLPLRDNNLTQTSHLGGVVFSEDGIYMFQVSLQQLLKGHSAAGLPPLLGWCILHPHLQAPPQEANITFLHYITIHISHQNKHFTEWIAEGKKRIQCAIFPEHGNWKGCYTQPAVLIKPRKRSSSNEPGTGRKQKWE